MKSTDEARTMVAEVSAPDLFCTSSLAGYSFHLKICCLVDVAAGYCLCEMRNYE